MAIWNPWHGCKKISSGCKNCYVYRRDMQFGKDSSIVTKTLDFDLPIKKNRNGEYKLQSKNEPIYTCMTSDFFIEDADQWRDEVWNFIKIRSDLSVYPKIGIVAMIMLLYIVLVKIKKWQIIDYQFLLIYQ